MLEMLIFLLLFFYMWFKSFICVNNNLTMKNIFVFLIIFTLTSCGDDRPTSNTDFVKIIGKPKILKNIEIAEYNFPTQMNWYNANEFCKKLGLSSIALL